VNYAKVGIQMCADLPVPNIARVLEGGCKQLPGDPDMVAKARELGHQGWELVSVAPYGNPEGLWH